MKVHHLDCCTMCPIGRRLWTGDGGYLEAARLVCHCLLVETDRGLVLVDTGIGTVDFANPRSRLGPWFVTAFRPQLDVELAAASQVRGLGFSLDDVRHIAVTHLDLDHAGALSDFPKATVHVYAREHAAAMGRATPIERSRYRPLHWAHNPRWSLYAAGGEPWFGFDCVRQLEGMPQEILLVPLVGHTRGHCGVAVDTGAGWLLHAGDAYFFHGEIDPDAPRSTTLLEAFQKLDQTDGVARLRNQVRLRTLVREHGPEVRVFCAHDAVEFDREKARRAHIRSAAA